MDLWITVLLISVAFSLGLCFGGLLATSGDPGFVALNEEYGAGYEDGLEDGRIQAHADYEAKRSKA